jgi:hypothetical protein
MKHIRIILAMTTITAICMSLFVSVPIMAAPPSVGSVSINPDPAYTDTPLVATPEGWSDADGDSEGYQWQWQIWDEGTSSWLDISGATTNTLDNSKFTLNDQIQVICTPFDGTDNGIAVEAMVTIIAFNYDVGIDVKPGSEENPINLKSNGVIPLAIYTTEGFDATVVDAGTVRFGPNEVSAVHFAYEDVDGDGDIDLILHFRTQGTGIEEDDTEVTLTGETASGMAFTGTDMIKIVPSKAIETMDGNESAPGQNKEPGESAEGKAEGKESAPGQNKEPGESATGKGKNKN